MKTFEFNGKTYERGGRDQWGVMKIHCISRYNPPAPIVKPQPWTPPADGKRPEGLECLLWHRGMWRHVKWQAMFGAWSLGYAEPFISDTPDRLYAPLPGNTPEHDFWKADTRS